jgi:hypothetical protein
VRLPLPPGVPTFGYTTAVDVGKDLVRNLMKDAATTESYFVTIMGRHAGHLALGIGSAAGATLIVIGEEFPPGPVSLDQIADILEGAIIKRRVLARRVRHPLLPGPGLLGDALSPRRRHRRAGDAAGRYLRAGPVSRADR